MFEYQHLRDFLEPLALDELFGDQSFHEHQFGHMLVDAPRGEGDSEDAPIVLVGVKEQRGDGFPMETSAPDMIRRQFYPMYHWHPDIRMADLGNIRSGATLADTYAALKAVVTDLVARHKTVIILGGSHDLTLAQYGAYEASQHEIEATVIDALIDLHDEDRGPSRRFLMEMLTGQPNFIRHYNHIGFQSYFIHPGMLETLDKLRFDCYRLGMARENMEEMEPVIRQSDMLSFDMCAIRAADAPASRLSPNGFTGDEACLLMRYAGMGSRLSTVGLYGMRAESDRDELTSIEGAQMLWYFLDGYAVRIQEAALSDRDAFLEFHVSFTDVETSFLKSKRTGRWWMQLPDELYIPCAYADYVAASRNETPERWLRAQERP